MFWLYNLLVLPLTALFVVVFALSPRRGLLKNLPAELAERLALYPSRILNKLRGKPLLWFHAASLGEIKALTPLIARVRAERPGYAVLLTTSNSVARERAAHVPGVDAAMLAPVDFYPLAARAVRLLQPKALIVAETELWPSLVRAARGAGAKLMMANARVSAKSAVRYGWTGRLMHETLHALDLVCAQTPEDAHRFLALSARRDRVFSVGNLKYDQFFDEAVDLAPLRERLHRLGWHESDPILVAGSTHRGEESAVLEAVLEAAKQSPHARLILAPRHLERLPEVTAALGHAGVTYALWSAHGNSPRPPQVVVVDSLGLLASLYGLARAAYVGGTLVPRGGHNLLEPVRFSVPVLFGPFTDNVQDIAALLVAGGGGLEVDDAEDLKKAVLLLMGDPKLAQEMGAKALTSTAGLRGATARTLSHLLPLL